MKLTNKKYDQAVLVCALSALSVSAWASSQSSALTEWPEGMDTKTFAAAQRDKFLLEKSSLEASIQAEAFAAINRKQQFQHRTQFIPLSLQLKPSEYGVEVVADVGEALGPWSNGHEMEDLERLIHNVAYNRLGERYGAVGVTMLFGGRTMYFYHPQERTPQKSESASAGNPSGPLMLSAGHGLFLKKSGAWEFQRPFVNKIQEDLITAEYRDELHKWVSQRSSFAVVQARSNNSEKHEPSTKPWPTIAARYNLEAKMPDNADIWDSTPDHPGPELHRDQDIRSRPLFANKIGANTLISLHTNADGRTSTRGTQVFIRKDFSNEERLLAESVLCSMTQTIHALTPYQTFPIGRTANTGSHGENRLATMPAIIIETAFHTHEEDAAALLDPAFRTAAMKGVERGYRLFREGKTCERFNIGDMDNVSVQAGEEAKLTVQLRGQPQYPVKLTTEFKNCPRGWACQGFEEILETNNGKPVPLRASCNGPQPESADFLTRLVDADGVTTETVERYVSCNKQWDNPGAPDGRILLSLDK